MTAASDWPTALDAVQERLGHRFSRRHLLEEALTHPSWNPPPGHAATNNQRLEFLGDAILHATVAHHLFLAFPDLREGDLSRRLHILCGGSLLASLGDDLGLASALRQSPAPDAQATAGRRRALEDAFEAVIGAVFLDAGPEITTTTILRLLGDIPARLSTHLAASNPKGRLQESLQPLPQGESLTYEVISSSGPPHNRRYTVRVSLGPRELGRGQGSSKKEAEDQAAQAALVSLPPRP